MKHHIVFVLYDSITNSVFDSQIAQPLISQQTNQELDITLISFERKPHAHRLTLITNEYPSIRFIFLQSTLFVHKILLGVHIQKLHALLATFSNYKLIARGPIAGYLCLQALQRTSCFELVIQARGILAEEYRFTHAKSGLFKILHDLRASSFENVEKTVYGKQSSYPVPVTIEAVSTALKEYLIQFHDADSNMITLASLDIPATFSREIITEWRTITRLALNIPENYYVYCYNGSLKPWQCPQETILYFKEQLSKNKNIFLLLLTQDKQEFERIILSQLIDPFFYKVITVQHKDIYRYLAACDAGIIFREKNAVNWTSRPTKILEYQAVNLSIIHNNTIALLSCQ